MCGTRLEDRGAQETSMLWCWSEVLTLSSACAAGQHGRTACGRLEELGHVLMLGVGAAAWTRSRTTAPPCEHTAQCTPGSRAPT